MQPVFPSEYVLYGHFAQGDLVALPELLAFVVLAVLAIFAKLVASPFKKDSSGVNVPVGHDRHSLPLAEK